MMHKKITASHYHIIYPVFLLLFLLVGSVFAIYQSQQTQQKNSHAASSTDCTVTTSQMTISSPEQSLFDKVNQYRVQHNVPKLTWYTPLKQAAAWLSLDMAVHNTISHTDSLGRTTPARLVNCGYNSNLGYGETLVKTSSINPDDALNYWKNSTEHNQILLTKSLTIAATAMVISGSNTYWTMDLGVGNESNGIVPTEIVPTDTPPILVTPGSNPTASPTPSDSANNPTDALNATPTLDPNEPTPTPAKVFADMQIAVKVKIAGIGKDGTTSPKHLSRKVTAYIYGTGTTPVTTGTGFLSYDGSDYFTGTIHLGKMAEGAYLIKLAAEGTLQVLAKPEFQTLLGTQVNTIPPVTLYQGDMNDDNILNIDDYNVALPCFQDKRCDTSSIIDFNDDGVTDVKDYNLLLQSFGQLHGN